MKTNKFMRIASVLLVAVVLTTCAISGTFAKYTSSTTANDSATVAKWSITLGGKDIQTQKDEVTFGLFDTINDSDNENDETDVVDTKIAPGTAGSFDLKVKNASEVTAKYTISFSAELNNVPLQFSTTGADNSWTTDITSLTFSDDSVAVNDDEATHTIYWKWDFEANRDTEDTTLGTTPVTATVTASITAEQVD